jgi:ATP-binding cassette subfamily C protein
VTIAHRLTQAQSADRVVVMADGAVVETGSHEELLAAGGGYAALCRTWAG